MQIDLFNNIELIQELAFNIYKYFLTIFLHKIRTIRNKETIRTFKFYDLYTYSAKLLKVSKKAMLLLNMKKTLNNFWAWIRAHTIFYTKKQRHGLKHYFLRIRDTLLGLYDIGYRFGSQDTYKAASIAEEKIQQALDRSDARINRKHAWLTQQREYRDNHDLRFKPKHYRQQTKEYINFLKKKQDQILNLHKVKEKLSQSLYVLNHPHVYPHRIAATFLTYLQTFKSRFVQMLYTLFAKVERKLLHVRYQNLKLGYESTQRPPEIPFDLDNDNQLNNEPETRLIDHYISWRTIKYAINTIKKRYVPYDQFKKIQRKFRRTRYKIFKRIRLILVTKESAKLQMHNMQYALNKALIKVKRDFALTRQYSINIINKKKREYLYSTDKVTARIFPYNFSELLKVFVKLFEKQYQILHPKKMTELKVTNPNIETNLLELKRIL